jgi:uncharacterized protein YggE
MKRKIMEVIMAASNFFPLRAIRRALRPLLSGSILAAAVFAATVPAQAQQPQPEPQARVIVTGEGSVSAAPDYAQIGGGVTTRAKTAREAADANSKLMTAITAALLNAGIAQKDIQTSRFSVQPVYAPPQANAEPKLAGFAVSNEVSVTVRQIGAVGDILDRLIATGATDVGNVEFLHSDLSKALDQAREAAIADARRKAELYARAAGVTLGRVAWIAEDTANAPPVPMAAMRGGIAAASVPISAGEDTLQARITVGFEIGS